MENNYYDKAIDWSQSESKSLRQIRGDTTIGENLRRRIKEAKEQVTDLELIYSKAEKANLLDLTPNELSKAIDVVN